jgi:hypothetical protein
METNKTCGGQIAAVIIIRGKPEAGLVDSRSVTYEAGAYKISKLCHVDKVQY